MVGPFTLNAMGLDEICKSNKKVKLCVVEALNKALGIISRPH